MAQPANPIALSPGKCYLVVRQKHEEASKMWAYRGSTASEWFHFSLCEKAPEIGESGPNGYAVVRVGRLPAAYHTGDFSRGYEKAARAFNIGFIGYPSVGNTAITRRYDPKENAICSGLGYYLEALSTHLLAKQGAEFFETSAFPSVPRIIQIDRIGLPAGKPVPAREWLLGLGRGIAYKMKNFILQQSLKQVA